MKVSVIMPARNSAHEVESTLDSIFAQTRLPDEIVVADGLSSDDTVARVQAYAGRGIPIKVVDNPTLFSGGGRNAATRAASHDLLVGFDFGNQAEHDWLAAMVAPFEADPELDYLGGVFYPQFESAYARVSGAIIYFDDCLGMTWSDEELAANMPANPLPGGNCMAYRRRIWEKAGGFSEWARKGQDRLYSLRVAQVGGKYTCTVHAKIHHHMGTSIRADFDRQFNYGLWIARTGLNRGRFNRLLALYTAGLFYIAFLSLAVAEQWLGPWAWLTVPIAMAGYAYVGAWRKLQVLARASGQPFTFRQKLLSVVVLFVKDAAVLSGNLVGTVDRLIRGRWRKLTDDYIQHGR